MALGQSIFFFALCRLVALRAARLVHQLARPPFTHAPPTGMIDRTAPSLRAQKFPEAMSFSTNFSRLSSATNRFSLAFSCSSSFSRRCGRYDSRGSRPGKSRR
jgi:hypothetical protein